MFGADFGVSVAMRLVKRFIAAGVPLDVDIPPFFALQSRRLDMDAIAKAITA